MRRHDFSDFQYKIDYTPSPKHHCVTASFICDGQPMKRFVFIPNHEHANYVEEAKEIVEREVADGTLDKYVKKYNRKDKKKLLIAALIAFAILAIIATGLLVYYLLFHR